MSPFTERLLTGLFDFGLKQLNNLGQRLPRRVRVRSWEEQLADFESRGAQQEAVERRREQERKS